MLEVFIKSSNYYIPSIPVIMYITSWLVEPFHDSLSKLKAVLDDELNLSNDLLFVQVLELRS
jgi:hypothetical protein